jgi:hypothetical protein
MSEGVRAALAGGMDARSLKSQPHHTRDWRSAGKRPERRIFGKKHLAQVCLRSAVLKIVQDRFAYRGKQREHRLRTCLAVSYLELPSTPVNVVQAQLGNFSGP